VDECKPLKTGVFSLTAWVRPTSVVPAGGGRAAGAYTRSR